MRPRLINIFFIALGVSIGIVLSLQVRSQPFTNSSYPADQWEIQKSLLGTFTEEQDQLKKELGTLEEKLDQAKLTVERSSSRKIQQELSKLKKLTDSDESSGEGIRISLQDNPAVSRSDFSSSSEDFIQAADLRDLINALFLEDARAITVNGRRISPLTPLQPVFDSILIGNFQIAPPFIIEAIGNPTALQEAGRAVRRHQIQIRIDSPVSLILPPLESRPLQHLSLTPLQP